MDEEGIKIGVVTHYYSHLQVGLVHLLDDVYMGDKVRFRGYTTDFDQTVDDMQYNHAFVDKGVKGQEVGIKVTNKVRENDCVYLVQRKAAQ